MKKTIIANGLVFIGILLYTLLFWEQKWGINSLIFSIFLTGGLFYLHPDSRQSPTARIAAFGVLLTAVMVVINNSITSKIVHVLALLVMVGFTQQRELRFLWFGILLALKGIFTVPVKILKSLRSAVNQLESLNPVIRNLKLGIIPLVILSAFYGIYYVANPKFASLSDSLWGSIGKFLFSWVIDISFDKLFFILSGLFVVGGFLWETAVPKLVQSQNSFVTKLFRQRKKRNYDVSFSMIGLKNEYRTALIAVVSLNLLLLIVNITDISYVWFNFDKQSPADLRTFVHEGTYLLIFAILMAMGIVLFFFRRNINFLPKNKFLRIGTYAWIAQNAILALSVAVRNYRYIDYHGLAYKRIGVVVFLILTLYGLYTMYIKVRDKKTVYFLLKNNSWALYITMLLLTTINWDVFISNYNIRAKTQSDIDIPFLINTISSKNLKVLHENEEILKIKASYPIYTDTQIEQYIDSKSTRFLDQQRTLGWQSWNLPDYRNKIYLESKGG